jgi:acetyltransferase-like isoleucine patch superfamily enzyme
MNNGWYTREELESMGFKKLGEDVQISTKASIYGAKNMEIGSHVRIDDFCMLIGNITLGSYIHIAAYTALHASMGSIKMNDFSTFSSRCTVYTASDDYSGESMTNSVVPEKYKNTQTSDITVGKHCIIGTGSCLLPGASLGEGVAVGCMSMLAKKAEPWGIYAGVPARRIKERSKKLLQVEQQMKKDMENSVEN